MEPKIILYISLGIVLFSAFMYVLFAFVAAYFVYTKTLKRQSPQQWSREPVLEGLEKQMYEEGLEWYRENAAQKHELQLERDGLKLFGEYYDLGNERCAIVLAGRSESLVQGYYFAQPYSKNGFNMLFLDPRAHGLSEGEFNTVGFEESRDIIAWAELIHNEFGVKSIVLHGICIGAAAGILALTSDVCPDYIDGIVTEGMFTTFGESLKNHMIEKKKPLFLTYQFINMWMKHYTGYRMDFGPIDVISKQTKPIMFLQGRKDIYSLPQYAQEMYDLCPAQIKLITWFDEGAHSLLRPVNKEQYDQAVTRYIEAAYGLVNVK